MDWTNSEIGTLERWTCGNTGLAAAIKDAASARDVSVGETLMSEGDAPRDVLLILSGTISIVVYSTNGHEVRLSTLGPGEWVGEMAVLNDHPRTAFAIAAEDGRVAVISATIFTQLMETYGGFAAQIARLLSERVAETSQRMFEFAAFSSSGRVYAEVIRLSVPGPDSEERHLRPPPSVTELAARLSIARETASRVVSRLERMQLLTREPEKWRVLAPQRLSDMIN